MIANGAGGVTEHVHGGDHRVDVAFGEPFAQGHIIAERRSLNNVAVIEKKDVWLFRARRPDQCRRLGEAHRLIRTVAIIVIREDIGVQIAGADQA
jgi:hypothetical protein